METIDYSTLVEAAANLAKIDDADPLLIGELEGEIHTRLREEPGIGRDSCTLGQRLGIDVLADILSKLFGVPVPLARCASEDAILPTRRVVTLRVIAEYVARLDGTLPSEVPVSTDTPTAIARARRRAK